MKHPRWSGPALPALLLTIPVACGGAREAPERPRPSSTASPPPAARPVDDPRCRHAVDAERLTLAAGQTATTRSGIVVRFAGAQHDHHDDGHDELWLELEFATVAGSKLGSWMPPAFAPPTYHVMYGQCVRVADGAPARVVVDLATPARRELPE